MSNTLAEIAKQIESYTKKRINKASDIFIYHTQAFQVRMGNNIEEIGTASNLDSRAIELLKISKDIVILTELKNNTRSIDFENREKEMHKVLNRLSDLYDIPDAEKNEIRRNLHSFSPIIVPESEEQKVFWDAHVKDFIGGKGRQRLQDLYEELVLRDFNLGKASWIDNLLGYLGSSQVHTEYGKINIQKGIDKLKKSIEKEKKDLVKRNESLLKKELNISDVEIKKLKKNLEKSKGRDDRGVQTLFRTTLKNHYTLNEMVDKKANIMITVNSIILSLVLGGFIGKEDQQHNINYLTVALLTLICGISIFYAILSIRPVKTQGNFSEEMIREKKGNLLYFGNFHKMNFRDFEWAFLQLLNDKHYLYGSMIRDYYHLAEGLNKKYEYIRKSLNFFLFGFLAVLSIHIIIQVSAL